ncbi:uncharacterized protein LOC114764836 [Denticeps clupeoides]|uniref:uncharacterized protein LOC114764836 n=1 Tax=Denticeps clupeoides TaxID=299321 RepID=UPI0010A5665E|nr:uncharacterized protein LOC114764836 [Denticeps clupeoides]XP_028810616.1 uncharacterized protein LOC114764836 [Denticeps clupeoides]XP_028810617.1 uncharacterized protein LOC114764836 [Denticeps clupeoides]XP_028810618.1 uncharacterized protein LOC114764836 [Denticeps clupeoides]XP_028810619.1 uncharacterized protein LOC114764836 [Denticeps clupeoides]
MRHVYLRHNHTTVVKWDDKGEKTVEDPLFEGRALLHIESGNITVTSLLKNLSGLYEVDVGTDDGIKTFKWTVNVSDVQQNTSQNDSEVNKGLIAGIVITHFLLVLCVGFLVYKCRKSQKKEEYAVVHLNVNHEDLSRVEFQMGGGEEENHQPPTERETNQDQLLTHSNHDTEIIHIPEKRNHESTGERLHMSNGGAGTEVLLPLPDQSDGDDRSSLPKSGENIKRAEGGSQEDLRSSIWSHKGSEDLISVPNGSEATSGRHMEGCTAPQRNATTHH